MTDSQLNPTPTRTRAVVYYELPPTRAVHTSELPDLAIPKEALRTFIQENYPDWRILKIERNLTVAALRRVCKAAGIEMKIETFSFGPAVSFKIGGLGGNVYSTEFYKEHKDAFDALAQIKDAFEGIEYRGQHLIGLKNHPIDVVTI